MDIPQRHSLSAQTCDAIRKAIIDGTWRDFLPSERRLCEILHVSRPTVRTALHQLAREGLVEIHQGRRNRLLRKHRQLSRAPSRLVGLFTPEPVSQMAFATFQGITEMRTHLSDLGFSTEVLICPPGSPRMHGRKLEGFISRNRLACGVLLSVSHDIQRWFQQRRIPALVLGSCHADVRLPSLDVDYRSVCRHAAGVLLGKGHRRIALLVPDSSVAGDLASEAGFREAAQTASTAGADFTVVRHGGTAQSIGAKLDVLFNSSRAPTALVVAKPQHVFIVILYLLKRGLTVPHTVSLIARDHDHIFETVSPPIAHYIVAQDTYAHRLSRLVQQLVNHGSLPSEPQLIFPKYFAGGTVKQLV